MKYFYSLFTIPLKNKNPMANNMKKFSALFLVFSFLISALPIFADEGMWTFDNLPLKQWKERYNFEPSQEWLDHIRLASVRLEGGSGSFVSPDGLLITNH